jgi:hypothetical protein
MLIPLPFLAFVYNLDFLAFFGQLLKKLIDAFFLHIRGGYYVLLSLTPDKLCLLKIDHRSTTILLK